MTNKPLHQAVIAPSMMYLLYQLDGDLPGYPRKQFEEDIVNECEKDIRSCFAAGAAHVVMDFTEGRLAPRNDPRNPWTTRNLLPFFVELGGDDCLSSAALIPSQYPRLLSHSIVWSSNMPANKALTTAHGNALGRRLKRRGRRYIGALSAMADTSPVSASPLLRPKWVFFPKASF